MQCSVLQYDVMYYNVLSGGGPMVGGANGVWGPMAGGAMVGWTNGGCIVEYCNKYCNMVYYDVL